MLMVKAWFGQNNIRYFGASLLMHLFLFGFFLFSLETQFNDNQLPPKAGDIVQATIVDQVQVEKEVVRLKTAEQQHTQEQETAQKQLTQKLEQVKHEREQEQVKLQKLKQDMLAAKKQLAALDDQRQAEQDRAKQMRQEREKEEKKKNEAKRKVEDAKRLAAAQAAKKAGEEAERAAIESQGRVTSEVQKVVGIWAEKIKSNKREAFGLATDLYCKLAINVLPDGSVKVSIIQSSGNPMYDDLSIKAVYKSEPFSLPEDPLVREQVKSFELGLKNDEGVE
jgi:membrane protein involved in colicin uptake